MRIRPMSLIALALAAALATAAQAAQPAGQEPSLLELLDSLYGPDALLSVEQASGPALDFQWSQAGPDPAVVRARAKFADLALSMGIIDGPVTQENLQVLLDQTGLAVDYHGIFDPPLVTQLGLDDPQGAFRLFLQTVSGNGHACGVEDSHILAFQIAAAPPGHEDNAIGSYVVAFENLKADLGSGRAWDFNEAVLEISGIVPVGRLTAPEPATLALLLAGTPLLLRRRRSG